MGIVEVFEVEVVTTGLMVLNIFIKEIFTLDFLKQTIFARASVMSSMGSHAGSLFFHVGNLTVLLVFRCTFTSNWSQKMHSLGQREHADACAVFSF